VQIERCSIEVPGPFSLKATALSHGWHECSPMSWSEGGRCFQVIERIGDDVYRVSVVEGERRREPATLSVTIEGRKLDGGRITEVLRRLRVVLGLDRNLGEFHELCRDHPTLWVVPLIGAGRSIRSFSMTENIIKALCATNVVWGQAVKMINRIGQLGPAKPHFVNLNAWPTPREIFKAGESYLLEVCRVGYRANSILAFCKDVSDRRFDPDELDAMAASPDVADEELLARLRSIRGIGPSSAHYLLSFLGRHGRVSVDSATIAHVARTHTNGKRPSVKEVERIYDGYGRWRQLAWWFEHWLTWGTAKGILKEHGLEDASKPPSARPKGPVARSNAGAKAGQPKKPQRKKTLAATRKKK